MSLEKRIEKAEEELQPEQAGRDILITIHEEQWIFGADDLPIPTKRPIIGYTPVEWSAPGRNGGRIGTRRALYDGGQQSSFDPEPDADHGIVRDKEVTGD